MGRKRLVQLDQVLDAGVDLLKERGLQGLTMAALGASLGVSPMTVYSCVASRDELLDLLAGRVLGDLPPVPVLEPETWQAVLYDYLLDSFRVLVAEPYVVELMDERPLVLNGVTMHMAAEFEALRGIGFSARRAAEVHQVLTAHAVGHLRREQWRLSGGSRSAADPVASSAPPAVVLAAARHLQRVKGVDLYASGVRALLAGLAAELVTT